MSSNIEIEDINLPWFETPDDFIKINFKSSENKFQEWIFENFKSFIEDVDIFEKGAEWSTLKWKILEKGSNQYNATLDVVLSKYRENVTPESFKELQRLRSEIVRDCNFFMIKNVIAEYDFEEFGGMKHVDFAHLRWDGKKYPVWIESIYNGTIRKIDVLIEYYESIGMKTDQPAQIVNENTKNTPRDTEVAPPGASKLTNQGLQAQKKKWSDYSLKYSYLTIILDHNAIGEIIPYGNKKRLLKVAVNRIGDKKKAQSLVRRSYEIKRKKIDLNSAYDLDNEFGDDWREVVLSLSKYPDELSDYLEKKYT